MSNLLPLPISGAKPFVEVGDTSRGPDDLHHRGMKLMNEIESDTDGVIKLRW